MVCSRRCIVVTINGASYNVDVEKVVFGVQRAWHLRNTTATINMGLGHTFRFIA